MSDSATSWTATPHFPVLHHLPEFLKLVSTESLMPSNHLILCHTLLLLPSIFPASGSFQMSQFFASGGQSIGVSASASVLPIEYSGLISFRIDWLGLLAFQGSLKSLLQHHRSKASILQLSAFFMVQLSHLCMTTVLTWCSYWLTIYGHSHPKLFIHNRQAGN